MRKLMMIVVVYFCLNANVFAIPVEVGDGVNSAYVYIEWADTFVTEFDVRFGSDITDTTTGMGLLDIIETNTSLTTVRLSGGAFIDGFSYLEHVNIGFQGDDNWWHYWTMESDTAEWTSPWDYGAADRIIENGDSDGQIYGRGTAVPEPTTIALLAIGGLLLRRPKASAFNS